MKLKTVTAIMLTLLIASMVVVLVGKAPPLSVVAQANSTATVYLDPPTIVGTLIDEEFTVNINIKDAYNVYAWQTGLTFNATLLECTGFFEGEFLSDVGITQFPPVGKINNTAGMIRPPYYCSFAEDKNASGNGRLAYATFKVKATGISNIHLSDVKVLDYPDQNLIPVNIIDVYTVVWDTASHTVVTVSNSTDTLGGVPSGLYGHSFNQTRKELSFKVTGPHPGFSNVTIPETLMWGDPSGWAVLIDGIPANKTVVYDGTHYSVYFTYGNGIHTIQITSPYVVPEFPTAIILSLFMFFTLIAVALTKKITIRKEDSNPPNTNN